MPDAPFKLLRTTVVGATVMGLAAGAHLAAGGTLPVAPVMAALLAIHILCSSIATKFRLRLPAMTVLLASSQLVLHESFDALSHGARLTGVPGNGMSADAQTAAMLAHAFPAVNVGAEAMVHASHMTGWMMAAHAASTLAAAGLLAYGENALWSLANWLRPLYRRAAVVLLLPPRTTVPGIVVRPLRRLPWRNVRPNTRRGPPRRATVIA